MSKQTAVEWLINVLDIDANDSATKEAINQAKAMEKEQIKEGYIMALLDGDAKIRRDAEDYYIETYGGEQ